MSPSRASSPAAGSVSIACPTSTSESSIERTSTSSPRSRSACSACAADCPWTGGIVTAFASSPERNTNAAAASATSSTRTPAITGQRRRARGGSGGGGGATRVAAVGGPITWRRRTRRGDHAGGACPSRRARPAPRQRAAELLGGAVALGGPLRERPQHDRLQLAGDARLHDARRHRLVADLLHRDGHGRAAVERHPPGEHLVEDDADRVAVAGGGHLVAARLLGRQVLGRADHRAGLGHVAVARRRGRCRSRSPSGARPRPPARSAA